MSEIKHTPLPWQYNYDDVLASEYADDLICNCEWRDEEGKANAAFIVRACNSHYELLEALKDTLSALGNFYDSDNDNRNDPMMQSIGKTMDKASNAIKKAEGG